MPPLTIRRPTADDAPGLTAHFADPEVFGSLLQLPYPSEALWQQRIAEHNAPGGGHLMLVAERDGDLLGCAGLHPASAAVRRRHVMALGISVSPHAQRQGVGSALMAALLDFADQWGQVLRIELTVYTDNEAAIRLYERFGFEREGLMRAYALRGGKFVDTLAMARLHPAPPALR